MLLLNPIKDINDEILILYEDRKLKELNRNQD